MLVRGPGQNFAKREGYLALRVKYPSYCFVLMCCCINSQEEPGSGLIAIVPFLRTLNDTVVEEALKVYYSSICVPGLVEFYIDPRLIRLRGFV